MSYATFADRYQSLLVPVIFEPWAKELIRFANPKPGEGVLDLACGTGVVTRQVANQVPDLGSLTVLSQIFIALAEAEIWQRSLMVAASDFRGSLA